MSVAVRDRVVQWVLVLGAIAAIVSWRLVGPWPAMVVGILAVLGACVAYRIESPRVGDPADVDEADHRERQPASSEQ